MSKRMLILPTFDGSTRGVAAVNADSIDLIRPASTPASCNVYTTGNHGTNCVNVHLSVKEIIEKLKEIGLEFTDLTGGMSLEISARGDSGGH